jgi:hypothetical protein
VTLIVARVLDGGVRIVADSQLSYGEETRFQTPFRGTLKVLALSPRTAVAYSSSHADFAVRAVHDAVRVTHESLQTVDARKLATALREHTATDDHEFLVASATTIHVIRSNTVLMDQPAAWIGDHAAFTQYQRLYHEHQVASVARADARAAAGFPFSYSVRTAMADALAGVIADASFPAVGGFSVALAADGARPDGFRYLPHSGGFDFQPVFGIGAPQSALRSKSVGQGGYNYSLLVPVSAGVPAIALHLVQGRIGVLFCPLERTDPVVVEDVDASTFMASVRRDYGIELTGMPWLSSS